MTRRILFQVHWLLGVTVGLVLALMGLTGATMSFEDEITGLLNSSTISVAKGAELMTPDALLASLRAQLPGEEIRPLVLSADPERAVQFRVRQPSGAATFYANPYDGHVLGKAGIRATTHKPVTRERHRGLVRSSSASLITRLTVSL